MKGLKNWEIHWPDYPKGMDQNNYSNSAEEKEKEVYFIQTGNTKGTTFKIKVNDYVFSSLFDTGAQVSCIKHDTSGCTGFVTSNI